MDTPLLLESSSSLTTMHTVPAPRSPSSRLFFVARARINACTRTRNLIGSFVLPRFRQRRQPLRTQVQALLPLENPRQRHAKELCAVS